MQVEVINKSAYALPNAATALSVGYDLRANCDAILNIAPLERVLVGTGLYVALPIGTEAQIRPRSGLALKKGLTVLNAPGTVDADYRGEIKVLLINLSNETVTIEPGERIAQLILAKHETIEWKNVDQLSSTLRGEGGYGHTGTK